MLPDERREKVLQFIEKKGFVSLLEIADAFQISESTARRDVEYLANFGQIRRTRGGAAYVGESLTPFTVRLKKAKREKRAIAARAVERIHPADTILLDGGTTTLELARHLPAIPIQVVTNSLPIINVLVSRPEIELIAIGGYVYPKTGVSLGPIAEKVLGELRVAKLFMSAGGITEDGLFNSNALLAETERRMMAAADEVIVLADSSKFGRSALARLCPLENVDVMIVDEGLDPVWRRRLEAEGIELVLAPLDAEEVRSKPERNDGDEME
ncbi:MAG: DeoR/GlpR transcriptional regulator [Planctomycetota bacterium]|nr:MAG: DeoR/GlpR transcriptional regulator [Planctomycetota bacterium]